MARKVFSTELERHLPVVDCFGARKFYLGESGLLLVGQAEVVLILVVEVDDDLEHVSRLSERPTKDGGPFDVRAGHVLVLEIALDCLEGVLHLGEVLHHVTLFHLAEGLVVGELTDLVVIVNDLEVDFLLGVQFNVADVIDAILILHLNESRRSLII